MTFGLPRNTRRPFGRWLAGGLMAAAVVVAPLSVSAQQSSRSASPAAATVGDAASGEGQGGGDASSGVGGQGGGSLANFGPIMQLIQTTIEPDSWIDQTSTMFPYPQGVMVDPAGMVRDTNRRLDRDVAGDIKMLLAQPTEGENDALLSGNEDAWRQSASLRCVSLRRLLNTYASFRSRRTTPTDAMLNVAGISEVRYVAFTADDIILAGPVGGIETSSGWVRDAQTGRAPLRLDALATSILSAQSSAAFGCSIDPTTVGLQAAAAVAGDIQSGVTPMGQAAERLGDAIGPQQVQIFGTQDDSALALLLVEADRHMKQLALGKHAMPAGPVNYLGQIKRQIAGGVPTDLLLRLWFNSNEVTARQTEDGRVVELTGTPIKLSGQNEIAMATGQRGNLTEDPRTAAFVSDFNRHWPSIRAMYPVYAALESVYMSATVAQVIRRHLDSESAGQPHALIAQAFAAVSRADQHGYQPPKQVDSLAVSHTFTAARKRHHVVIVSGGVSVDASQMIGDSIEHDVRLNSMRDAVTTRPELPESAWWWNR